LAFMNQAAITVPAMLDEREAGSGFLVSLRVGFFFAKTDVGNVKIEQKHKNGPGSKAQGGGPGAAKLPGFIDKLQE